MASPTNMDTTAAAAAVSEPALSSSPTSDRRNSVEWDASKVPPSRFQKRKGSIYAVPSSRDGHVDSNYNTKFHEKHKELWKAVTGTGSNTNSS